MSKESPKKSFLSNLVGSANESTVIFCGTETTALIDSGSMVTTVSEDYLQSLHPTPTLYDLDNLILKGPDGKSLPYLGYI